MEIGVSDDASEVEGGGKVQGGASLASALWSEDRARTIGAV
jgi:hypothetical protein